MKYNGKGISEFQIQEINRGCEIEKNEFQGNGISLININSRLKKFYNKKLNFETNKEGTKVYFTIPMVESSKEGDDDKCNNFG